MTSSLENFVSSQPRRSEAVNEIEVEGKGEIAGKLLFRRSAGRVPCRLRLQGASLTVNTADGAWDKQRCGREEAPRPRPRRAARHGAS